MLKRIQASAPSYALSKMIADSEQHDALLARISEHQRDKRAASSQAAFMRKKAAQQKRGRKHGKRVLMAPRVLVFAGAAAATQAQLTLRLCVAPLPIS